MAVFVEKYGEEDHPIPSVSAVDMLRYLIETRQKTQREVAAGAGLADSTNSWISVLCFARRFAYLAIIPESPQGIRRESLSPLMDAG
jgi:hypothetical protein